MFDETIGSKLTSDVGECLRADVGRRGHAVWGPYERLEAGCYEVEFLLRRVEPADGADNRDELCAVLDVSADNGSRFYQHDFVFASHVGDGFSRFVLPFRLSEAATVEYRVHVMGAVPLDVAGRRDVRPLADDASVEIAPGASLPPMLRSQRGVLKAICDEGGSLVRVGDHLEATLQGIRFAADEQDDINFVDEIFRKNAYNFTHGAPSCVIDVGMNVGLASLLFATRPGVREVHAFEPFVETYAREMANISRNPELAARIVPYNFGLGDGDAETTFFVGDTHGDSGAQSTVNVDGGRPVQLSIRDAGKTLAPILTAARRRGLATIVKIDCEGSEFDVFRSIGRAGLWPKIDFVMVEWHRMFPGLTQWDLLTPLHKAGFLTVDLSPQTGNGFFYAARLPSARRTAFQKLFTAFRQPR